MKDFIFGTLATEELRLEHERILRAGVSHNYQRSPRDPSPGQDIFLKLSVGPRYPCEIGWVYWTNDGSDPIGSIGVPINGQAISLVTVGIEWDTLLWGYKRVFEGMIPGQAPDTVVKYKLSSLTPTGEEIFADNGTQYGVYVADDPPPKWSEDAIIYQIFVDRFSPGAGNEWHHPKTPAGFYGGTLRGIIEKLEYLDRLGVNTLWLTPIFPSPSHHGYDATELTDIEPRLGTKADLINLLREAHTGGLRVILDLVPNHVSNQHPSFKAAISDQNSPYHDWYTFTEWPNRYQSFFDVPELPQLNLRNPKARKYMLDAIAYWLDIGVDGYRVDYAIGPTPDFWADFRRVTRNSKPDCWTFGEVVEPPDSQINFSGGLDGCLDFNLMEAIRNLFAYGDWDAERFASYLQRHEDFFPVSFSRPSFLDNHDMNRFLWAAEGDIRKLRLAALCQFTLSGAPIIYYGTEVGLSQARDVRQDGRGLPEESRLPMCWGDDQDVHLLEFYRQLIQVRKDCSQLRHGKAKFVYVDKNCLLYTRGTNDELLVVLNPSISDCYAPITGSWKYNLIQTSSEAVRIMGQGVSIASLGGAVFAREQSLSRE